MYYLNRILVLASFIFIFGCTEKKKPIPTEDSEVDVINVLDDMYVEPEDILVYTIQVGAYTKENRALETSVDNIMAVEEDGLIKYRLGNFSTYKSADELKKSLLSTYSDAFIVAIYNEERIGIQEALTLSNELVK